MAAYHETHTHRIEDLAVLGDRIMKAVGDTNPPLLRATLLLLLAVTDWPGEEPPDGNQLRDVVEPASLFLTDLVHDVCEKGRNPNGNTADTGRYPGES